VNGGDLAGLRVVVTRSTEQAAPLIAAIEAAGGRVVRLPLLEIRDPESGLEHLVDALRQLGRDDWLAVTSPNGAHRVIRGVSARPDCSLAVVGAGTAAVFEASGWAPDLVADVATAADLASAFPPPAPGARVLVVQGDLARPTLVDGLQATGWPVSSVVAYVNVQPPADPDTVTAAGGADMVVFASPSAVARYDTLLGATPAAAICIGEVTAAAARERGFDTTVAAAPTVDGILAAIRRRR